jgi:hypothetical protein
VPGIHIKVILKVFATKAIVGVGRACFSPAERKRMISREGGRGRDVFFIVTIAYIRHANLWSPPKRLDPIRKLIPH